MTGIVIISIADLNLIINVNLDLNLIINVNLDPDTELLVTFIIIKRAIRLINRLVNCQ